MPGFRAFELTIDNPHWTKHSSQRRQFIVTGSLSEFESSVWLSMEVSTYDTIVRMHIMAQLEQQGWSFRTETFVRAPQVQFTQSHWIFKREKYTT